MVQVFLYGDVIYYLTCVSFVKAESLNSIIERMLAQSALYDANFYDRLSRYDRLVNEFNDVLTVTSPLSFSRVP